jgi:hypothetical protein
VLVEEALQQQSPWEWISQELRFEAKTVIWGNRARVALGELQCEGELTDAVLDTYNQRLQRFAKIDPLDQA